MEQVIVQGRATGRTRSLNMKRAAMNVVNVVSADNIGNFPDQNVAEALSRVPGVSIVRNRGEGRYVNIRGIDAELNAYFVDGLSLASPRGNERAIALDIIPSDVVERLVVSKTLLPDQPADSVGGAVNVISQSVRRTVGQDLLDHPRRPHSADQDQRDAHRRPESLRVGT